MERPFRVPFSPVFPIIGVLFCFWLMKDLPITTWVRFVIWLVVGLVIYFSYSRRHSIMQTGKVGVPGQPAGPPAGTAPEDRS
jgi:APA family basic amino acid/polyamine antiporter